MSGGDAPGRAGDAGRPEEVEGLEVPVSLSLTQPLLIGGVPRPVAIVVGTMTAALTLGLQVWWIGLPLGLALHAAAAALTRSDPHWFDVFKRQARQPHHLEG